MPKTKKFKKLFNSVKKTYLGKPVPSQYKARYGQRYDKSELKSIAIAIAKSRGMKV